MTTQLEAFPKTTLEVLTELSGIHRDQLERATKALDALSDDEQIAKRYDKAESRVAACRALVAAIDQAVVRERERERLTGPGVAAQVAGVDLTAVAALACKTFNETAPDGVTASVVDPVTGEVAFPPERDELIADAVKLVVATAAASASLLQRRLNIGYGRASEILYQLEALGVIGCPAPGGKARPVLIDESGIDAVLAKAAA